MSTDPPTLGYSRDVLLNRGEEIFLGHRWSGPAPHFVPVAREAARLLADGEYGRALWSARTLLDGLFGAAPTWVSPADRHRAFDVVDRIRPPWQWEPTADEAGALIAEVVASIFRITMKLVEEHSAVRPDVTSGLRQRYAINDQIASPIARMGDEFERDLLPLMSVGAQGEAKRMLARISRAHTVLWAMIDDHLKYARHDGHVLSNTLELLRRALVEERGWGTRSCDAVAEVREAAGRFAAVFQAEMRSRGS